MTTTRRTYYVDLKDAIIHAQERGAEFEVWDVLAEGPATLYPLASATVWALHGPKVDWRITLDLSHNGAPTYGGKVSRIVDMTEGETISTREAVARLDEMTASHVHNRPIDSEAVSVTSGHRGDRYDRAVLAFQAREATR